MRGPRGRFEHVVERSSSSRCTSVRPRRCCARLGTYKLEVEDDRLAHKLEVEVVQVTFATKRVDATRPSPPK